MKAVFFDIGNVLLHFEPGCIFRKFVRVLRTDRAKIAAFMETRGLLDSIERGTLTPEGFFAAFRRAFDYRGDFRSFKLLWSNHFKLEADTAALLKAAARRRKVYLLSNTNRIHYDYIRRRYAFTRHVHGACLSHEVGLRKPEPAIYREALRLARVRPAEAVFIDDIPENVAAACKLGIRAFLYHGPSRLRRLFRRLDIA